VLDSRIEFAQYFANSNSISAFLCMQMQIYLINLKQTSMMLHISSTSGEANANSAGRRYWQLLVKREAGMRPGIGRQ
jgi:hypothetical protein